MKKDRPKTKNTLTLLLLCALILVAAVLFLFVAQNQPILRWVSNPVVGESSSMPIKSDAEEPAESQIQKTDLSKVWEKDWRLVLVNWEYSLPEDYSVQLTEAYDMQIDQRIVEPYEQMAAAASKDGITLWLSSAYRDPKLQEKLLEREIQQNQKNGMSYEEAREKAVIAVAEPGHSEHSTGLAIDVNGVRSDFEQEKGYQWLLDHAADYGFVLRYSREKQDVTKIMFEPWHYRYVGPEHAKKMKELNLCLEEYVNYLAGNAENN
ncbi:M15 family metallopeptidase [Clostridium minihomine]|uniref:M15 family metallopeptidase n=1 Tax=Clostridium minihomine TaxID=2045012 RepID=UPI000C77A2FE|nr:M15 family metallopeptidase [Clostridium minihomine]